MSTCYKQASPPVAPPIIVLWRRYCPWMDVKERSPTNKEDLWGHMQRRSGRRGDREISRPAGRPARSCGPARNCVAACEIERVFQPVGYGAGVVLRALCGVLWTTLRSTRETTTRETTSETTRERPPGRPPPERPPPERPPPERPPPERPPERDHQGDHHQRDTSRETTKETTTRERPPETTKETTKERPPPERPPPERDHHQRDHQRETTTRETTRETTTRETTRETTTVFFRRRSHGARAGRELSERQSREKPGAGATPTSATDRTRRPLTLFAPAWKKLELLYDFPFLL
ncbi:unnamed protein product [Boreogadus saida]